MRIVYVGGTRPTLVKPALGVGARRPRLPDARHTVVHTGQHYDRLMSEVFFEQLGMPEPDHMLAIGSGTHAEQTAWTMERLEPGLAAGKPDPGVVPGGGQPTPGGGATGGEKGSPG